MTDDQLQKSSKQTDEKQTDQLLQIIVFVLNKEEYAVPIDEIREVIKIPKITPVPNSAEFILGVINLRGKIVPIINIEKRFGLVRNTEGIIPEHVIVTQDKKGTLFGVQVDQVTEVLKVSQDMVQPTPTLVTSKISTEYLGGVIVLSEERVLLLLNLQKILTEQIQEALNNVVLTEGGV